MKTEPAPEDLRPRTPYDPEDFDPVFYEWNETQPNCRSCPFWTDDDRVYDNLTHRKRCPQLPDDGRSPYDRIACLGPNRPDGEYVMYFKKKKKLYGNEKD